MTPVLFVPEGWEDSPDADLIRALIEAYEVPTATL